MADTRRLKFKGAALSSLKHILEVHRQSGKITEKKLGSVEAATFRPASVAYPPMMIVAGRQSMTPIEDGTDDGLL